METKPKINFNDIPDGIIEAGCRIISKSIRKFYQDPENRKKLEEWRKTPDGKRASLLTKEERLKFDAEHAK